jgi:hypothetical protein
MSEVAGPGNPLALSTPLQRAAADYVARTKGRVAFQSADRVVVITGHPVNHVLHLLLTVITGGVWVFAWAYASAVGGEQSRTLTLGEDGAVLGQDTRTTTTGQVRLPRVAGAVLVVRSLLLHPFGVPGGVALVGFVVLGGGGLALMVTDIGRYGVGRAVTVPRL